MSPPPIIHDISFNHPYHPRPFTTLEKQIEIYVTLQHEICYDYRDQPASQPIYDYATELFKALTPQKLKRGVDLRLAPFMFELCLRSLSESLPDDIGCPVEPMDIMQYLAEVGGLPHTEGNVFDADPILRLQATAALAWIFFRQYFWTSYPDCFEVSRGAMALEQCVYLSGILAVSDFVPPIVPRIASWLSTVKVRYAKLEGRVMFREFCFTKDFWKAYETYVEYRKIEEEIRLAKVANAPNQYRCAADGCGIQAVNKSALRKCGGDCLPDKKPHYCSVGCQVRHWFVHRSVCKGGEYADIAEDDGDPAWEDVELYRPTQGTKIVLDPRAVWADRKGPEIFIDVPNCSRYRNEVFRIRTKTMSPAFLKSYRDLWKTRSLRVRQLLQRDLLPWPDAISCPPYDDDGECANEVSCPCKGCSEDSKP